MDNFTIINIQALVGTIAIFLGGEAALRNAFGQ